MAKYCKEGHASKRTTRILPVMMKMQIIWLVVLASRGGVTSFKLFQDLGRTISQGVSHRLLAVKVTVQLQATSLGQDFLQVLHQFSFRQWSLVILLSVAGTMGPFEVTVPRDSVSPHRKKRKSNARYISPIAPFPCCLLWNGRGSTAGHSYVKLSTSRAITECVTPSALLPHGRTWLLCPLTRQ
jgi:hypothetical protein